MDDKQYVITLNNELASNKLIGNVTFYDDEVAKRVLEIWEDNKHSLEINPVFIEDDLTKKRVLIGFSIS